jgi:hypothetical protein
MQPWTALWVIKDVPNDGYEVIRDGRHVGIGRCGEFEDAVDAIVRHDLYETWDRVVFGWGRHRCEVDVAAYRREVVGV